MIGLVKICVSDVWFHVNPFVPKLDDQIEQMKLSPRILPFFKGPDLILSLFRPLFSLVCNRFQKKKKRKKRERERKSGGRGGTVTGESRYFSFLCFNAFYNVTVMHLDSCGNCGRNNYEEKNKGQQ